MFAPKSNKKKKRRKIFPPPKKTKSTSENKGDKIRMESTKESCFPRTTFMNVAKKTKNNSKITKEWAGACVVLFLNIQTS